MEVAYQFFPEILNDNDEIFFHQLIGICESVDEYAELEISKFPENYAFRLIASHPKYNNMLIQELIKFHNLFQIKMDLSKSIKSSSVISYKIPLL